MKTVAAYIRVSTEDQIEFSPDSQIKAIRTYAKTHDLYLPDNFIFVDEGISGRTTKKRPAFVQMIALAKSTPKPFDAILVWKYSRFARNREDSVVYKSMLRKQYNIDVVSISENVGDDKMSILFEAMIEAMDEYYSINLAEEVKRGMTEKAKRGGVLAVPGFGYSIKDGKYIINSEQAQIIQKVFKDYLDGKGMLTIAKELNALHITTNRGNPIENRTVEYWLNNPLYIGKIRWNPNGRMNRRYHANGLIVSDGEHEPIIDMDTWNAVQDKLKKTKKHYQKYMRNDNTKTLSHWLTGVLRCGNCGAVLGHYGHFFGCSNKGRGICEGCGTISVHIAEKLVLNTLHNILTKNIENIIVAPPTKNKQNDTLSPKHILLLQIQRAEERLTRVKEAYEAGVDTLDEYTENKQKIQNEINAIKAEITRLSKEDKSTPNASTNKVNIQLQDNVKRVVDILDDDNIDNWSKREILQDIVKEIVKITRGSRALKMVFWEHIT